MSSIPLDIAAKLREIGPVIDPPATAALYVPLHEKEPYPGVRIVRDIKYGPHERQALDLFVPEGGEGRHPVFVYVHGGGYTAGHKRDGASPFFDNFMLWAARNGMVGVNMTYRLAPKHPWPAGAEDVAAAVAWIRRTIASYGGDTGAIFLCGHSAGGTHVASYAAMPQFHDTGGAGLKGLILLSSIFDLTIVDMDERYRSYFGEDAGKYADRSPFFGLPEIPAPILVAWAELDPPFIAEQSERIDAALRQAGRNPHSVKLAGHSHISIVQAVNSGDTELSDAMLEFVNNHH